MGAGLWVAEMPRKSRVVTLRAALAAPIEAPMAAEGGGRLHDVAYGRIREAMMEGRFAPGQTFSLRALAEVLGTSAMPIRDALKRLVAEHALQLRANGSVMLPPMTRARFQEILQARLAVEPLLASRGTGRVSGATIRAMMQDHVEMCAAAHQQDARGFLAANRRFHFRLYEAADSCVMLPIVEGLWIQVGPHLHRMFRARTGSLDTAGHHHLDLLRALRRQDATAAGRAVFDDLSDAADGILQTDLFDDEAA
jgi:DNA-binding GntR family transcriptional regulator